jgi:pimeloyl-ACP methyl ester carboxylesterase
MNGQGFERFHFLAPYFFDCRAVSFPGEKAESVGTGEPHERYNPPKEALSILRFKNSCPARGINVLYLLSWHMQFQRKMIRQLSRLKIEGSCGRVQKIRKKENEKPKEEENSMAEVMVRGIKIHYLEIKSLRSAVDWLVLFIHGSGGNAGLWQRVMEGLAEGYRSIAVDLPGHGLSQGDGFKSVSEYGDFVNDFLEALELRKVVLGGHSLGGAVVQDLALRHPQKLKALLLIGTGARLRVLPEALESMRKMASGEIPPQFYPWGFSEKASPEVIAEGERAWAKTGSSVRYHDFLACDQFDLIGEIEKIRLPSLIACGKEDHLTPVKYSQFLNQKLPGSRMELIDGAGHLVMLENPRALSQAILNFLGGL